MSGKKVAIALLILVLGFGLSVYFSTNQILESRAKAAEDIAVGSDAPMFTLPNADGEDVALAILLREGPVVLSFYRGGWCPYCNEQLAAYQEILPEFAELGASLVAISPEKPESAQDTAVKNELSYTVLSDEGNRVARLYDLIWTVPKASRAKFAAWLKNETGKSLNDINGEDTFELPIPATIIINQDGKVVYMFKDENYRTRANNAEILGALKELTSAE